MVKSELRLVRIIKKSNQCSLFYLAAILAYLILARGVISEHPLWPDLAVAGV